MRTFKITFLVSAILVIACVPLLSIVGNTGTFNSNDFSDVAVATSSAMVSAPILIEHDNDWLDLINSGRCTGQGTLNDPYIVSNLKIDGGGLERILIASVRDVYLLV